MVSLEYLPYYWKLLNHIWQLYTLGMEKFFHILKFDLYQGHMIKNSFFIVLIHPIQWTIAYLVGADRPAKRQKKTSCVSTGRLVPVLCTRKVVHRTSFLSRQHDVIASFSLSKPIRPLVS